MEDNSCYFSMVPYINGFKIASASSVNHKKLFSLMLGYDRWTSSVENKSKNNEAILSNIIEDNLEKMMNHYQSILEKCETFKKNTTGWENAKIELIKDHNYFFINKLTLQCPFYDLESGMCTK